MRDGILRVGAVRVGSVVLAVTAGLLFAHCGGDDTPSVAEDGDTGTFDETSTEAGDETSAETGDETSTDAGEETSAEAGDETSTDAGSETSTEAGGETSTEAGGDADTCGTLATTAVDVYVDKASTKASVGTTACPFHTIKEATDLAAVSGRTIHVKGGSAATPANYAETGALVVKSGVTLEGDGLTTTKITNAAACTGGSMCAVEVAGNGILDGFTITGTGNGVVTDDADAAATVRNVLVTGAQDGILALGTLKLTGGVQASTNKLNGLHAKATGNRTVTISGTGNEFDSNTGKGILFEGSSKLDGTGGSASSNGGGGIYLSSTVASTSPHLITGFTVKSNGVGASAVADGIRVANTSSLKLRTTVVQANGHHGLTFVYSVTNALDIGPAGGNSFSSMTASLKNGAAGVCLQDSGAAGSVDGNGNKWAGCSIIAPVVTETAITVECSGYNTQNEIAYRKSASGGTNPVAITPLTGCTTAP